MSAAKQPAEFVLRGRGPNTMTVASLNALADWLAANPDTPLLLRGAGNAFSAGLDLDAVIADGPAGISAAIEAAAEALFLHAAPTVAAINGHAIAGGCLIAQCCDLRVLTDTPHTKMGMPGVALGINYPPTLLAILRYRVPAAALERVLLGAANHPPQTALTLGLVDELAADVVTTAQRRLAELAAHPREAYAETKRALRAQAMQVSSAERERFEQLAAQRWAGDSLQANRTDKRR